LGLIVPFFSGAASYELDRRNLSAQLPEIIQALDLV
jgi:hypothetical protein